MVDSWLAVNVLVAAFLSYLVTRILLPQITLMLSGAGFVRPNFRKEEIPLGAGLVFFLSVLVILTIGKLIDLVSTKVFVFLFAIGAMSLVGLIDDVFGSRHASGLKGHFRKLLIDRELTTGALKALMGGIIALMVSVEIGGGTGLNKWFFILVNTLIVALSTNTVNLLDLRPGRAAKGFTVFLLVIAVFSAKGEELVYAAAVTGSLLAYLPYDLKARAMMGDTGSNVLGITLGYFAASALTVPAKIGFLAVLVGFHIFTEKYSLTRIIEENRFLTYLDMLGRSKGSE